MSAKQVKKLPIGKGLNRGSSAQLKGYKPVEMPLLPQLERARQMGMLEQDVKAYKMGSCTIMVGWSEKYGWHLSIAHHKRYPTWEEVVTARYSLIPDEAAMAMMLPSQKEYIDMHQFCFQLHEIKDWQDH